MELDEHVYTDISPPLKSKTQDKKGHEKVWIRLVVTICVLLFLSLLANAILTCLYCKIKLAQSPSPLQYKCSGKKRIEHWIPEKDRLYVFSDDKLTWDSGRHRCQKLGGDLVIVNSQEEHEFLAKAVGSTGNSELHWIGLTDAVTEGVWLWVDKTQLNKNLTWWSLTPDKNQDPLGEDCAVYYNGNWADVPCSMPIKTVCELSCSPETA